MEHDHPRRSPGQRNNTYSVRWLRETSPQKNQIIPNATQAVTARAAREEADVDQTLATNFNTVLSNTKVNTMRLTWTRENVTFANACFNGNGRDLSKCEPTLSFQNFIDQQDNTGQSRINDAHPARRHDGLVHAGQARRSRPEGRRAVPSTAGADNANQGNLNGTFAFGRNNAPFNAADPRTYPDRFTIRVGGPSIFYEKAHYIVGVRAGQVAVQHRA